MRTVRLIRDFISISFIIQFYSAVILIIRAVGFDIKKFDFNNDLKEMEINESDREEFEVQINFDKNKTLIILLWNSLIPVLLFNLYGFCGDFWIDFEEGICKINVLIEFDKFTADKKKELIKIAKNKKNAQAKGLFGKIRSALEDFFLDSDGNRAYDLAWQFNYANAYCVGMDYSCLWSLKQYKNDAPKEEKQEWDDLEKSIIASIADDVIVGVKGKSANIVVVTKFV